MKKFKLKSIIKKVLPIMLIGVAVWFFFIRPKEFVSIVTQVKVEERNIERTLSASGKVKSASEGDLAFNSSGKILRILVEEGDLVTKGQLLAILDNTAYQHTSQSLKDGRDALIRTKELFEQDKYNNIKLLGGETEYNLKLRVYDEQISQANSSYMAQLATTNGTYIYASTDGTVIDVLKNPGEVAVASETIIKIADLNNLVFTIEVDQEDFGSLTKDKEVRLELDSYDRHEFTGHIRSLPYFASAQTGSFEIEIDIESNQEFPIKLGMSGDAFIILDKTETPVKSLSFDEIQYDVEDNTYVWTVENNKLIKKYVELGLEGDVYTEVKGDAPEYVLVPVKDSPMEDGYTARIINLGQN